MMIDDIDDDDPATPCTVGRGEGDDLSNLKDLESANKAFSSSLSHNSAVFSTLW
jgi:hypothetical protein